MLDIRCYITHFIRKYNDICNMRNEIDSDIDDSDGEQDFEYYDDIDIKNALIYDLNEQLENPAMKEYVKYCLLLLNSTENIMGN